MTDTWLTLNQHRSSIDCRIFENRDKAVSPVDSIDEALYLAVRLIPNTKHSGVAKTEYNPMFPGEDTQFPDPAKFEELTWIHLEEAVRGEADCRLRAHGADLLWVFRGQYSMARIALDSFQTTYSRLNLKTGSASQRVDYLIALYRSLELSREINDQPVHDSITRDILDVLGQETSSESVSLSGFDLDLFRLAKSRIDHFSADQKALIYQFAQDLRRKGIGNEHLLLQALEVCESIARSMGMMEDVAVIVADTAKYWLKIAGGEDGSGLGEAERIRQAIVLIRSLPSGHSMKSNLGELERKRQELLSDITQFATFDHELAMETKLIDGFLSNLPLPDGKEPLALSVFLIASAPTRDSARAQLEEHKAAAPLLHLISHIPIEADGLSETFLQSEGEKDNYFITQNVETYMRAMSAYLVMMSYREGVRFTRETLLQLVPSSDLLNASREETIDGAINAYFDGKFLLCVSLLAMEFEPAIKHLFKTLGWNYVVSGPDGAQHEVQLDDLLSDPRLSKVLDERWILVAQAILTDKGGQKLRHKVAHGRGISHLANREFATLLLALFLYFCNLTAIG